MTTGRRRRAPRSRGGIRIIGGEWRGRRLAVPDRPGLRPTTDRARETLFNWLQAHTAGARCLDLFAGSGALGLEALSRGAASCTFVDSDRRAIAALERSLDALGARGRARCFNAPAERFLERDRERYDLVFLDPPFDSDLLTAAAAALEAAGLCRDEALIYVESDRADAAPLLPAGWAAHREASGGGVSFGLYRRGAIVGTP